MEQSTEYYINGHTSQGPTLQPPREFTLEGLYQIMERCYNTLTYNHQPRNQMQIVASLINITKPLNQKELNIAICQKLLDILLKKENLFSNPENLTKKVSISILFNPESFKHNSHLLSLITAFNKEIRESDSFSQQYNFNKFNTNQNGPFQNRTTNSQQLQNFYQNPQNLNNSTSNSYPTPPWVPAYLSQAGLNYQALNSGPIDLKNHSFYQQYSRQFDGQNNPLGTQGLIKPNQIPGIHNYLKLTTNNQIQPPQTNQNVQPQQAQSHVSKIDCICSMHENFQQSLPSEYEKDKFMIKCTNDGCQTICHRGCMKIQESEKQYVERFECPRCILQQLDPLMKPDKDLNICSFQIISSHVQKSSTARAVHDIMISDELHSILRSPNKNHIFIEIRCIRLEGQYLHEITWPDQGQLDVNEHKITEFKPLAINSSLKQRKDEKILVQEAYIKPGINKITIKQFAPDYSDNQSFKICANAIYLTAVLLVKKIPSVDLLQDIAQNNVMSEVQSKIMIEKKFEQTSRSSDQVTLDRLAVNLTCSYTLQAIKYPGRGRYCEHIQCFSLENIITATESLVPRKWRCPICKNRCYDLYLDGYQLSLINQLKEENKELQEITFYPNGLHEVTKFQVMDDGNSDFDDDLPPPNQEKPIEVLKAVKSEDVNSSLTHKASAPTTQQVNNKTGPSTNNNSASVVQPKKQVQFIVLDDEDEPEIIAPVILPTQTQNVSDNSAQNNLGDDSTATNTVQTNSTNQTVFSSLDIENQTTESIYTNPYIQKQSPTKEKQTIVQSPVALDNEQEILQDNLELEDIFAQTILDKQKEVDHTKDFQKGKFIYGLMDIEQEQKNAKNKTNTQLNSNINIEQGTSFENQPVSPLNLGQYGQIEKISSQESHHQQDFNQSSHKSEKRDEMNIERDMTNVREEERIHQELKEKKKTLDQFQDLEIQFLREIFGQEPGKALEILQSISDGSSACSLEMQEAMKNLQEELQLSKVKMIDSDETLVSFDIFTQKRDQEEEEKHNNKIIRYSDSTFNDSSFLNGKKQITQQIKKHFNQLYQLVSSHFQQTTKEENIQRVSNYLQNNNSKSNEELKRDIQLGISKVQLTKAQQPNTSSKIPVTTLTGTAPQVNVINQQQRIQLLQTIEQQMEDKTEQKVDNFSQDDLAKLIHNQNNKSLTNPKNQNQLPPQASSKTPVNQVSSNISNNTMSIDTKSAYQQFESFDRNNNQDDKEAGNVIRQKFQIENTTEGQKVQGFFKQNSTSNINLANSRISTKDLKGDKQNPICLDDD